MWPFVLLSWLQWYKNLWEMSPIWFWKSTKISQLVVFYHQMQQYKNQHNSGIKMSMMGSQITSISIVCQPFVRVHIKENIKALRHWLLWGNSTGDQWIPCTKGKCFHLMTSSWKNLSHCIATQVSLNEYLLAKSLTPFGLVTSYNDIDLCQH